MFFYVEGELSYHPARADIPYINAEWDRWSPSDPNIKFEGQLMAKYNADPCMVKHVVFWQVPCMEVGVSETHQKAFLLLLPAGVPQNFDTNFGLEQTLYCLLHEGVTRLLGTVIDFGHAGLDGTCRHILDGLDCLKQDRINHRIASRTTEDRRAGNQDPSIQACHAPPPSRTFWGRSLGQCEYRSSAVWGERCGGSRHGKGTRSDHHRLDFPRSANCKHRGYSRLTDMCMWASIRSGRYTITTAQGSAWSDRSRTILEHTQGIQGRAGHEHVRVSPTASVNDYANTTARSDEG